MTWPAKHRRAAAWLAALALLVATLLPGLAQVFATHGVATRWVEVCSHGGSTWVAVNDDDTPASAGSAGQAGGPGCPYCLLAAGLAPGPEPATLPRVFGRLPTAAQRGWTHVPSGAAWTAGAQRAPPQQS